MDVRFKRPSTCSAQRADEPPTILFAAAFLDGLVWHERIGHSIFERCTEFVFRVADLPFRREAVHSRNCLSRGRLSSRVDIPDLLCAGRPLLLAVGEYSTFGDTEFMERLGIGFAPPAISLLWCVRVLGRSGSLYPLHLDLFLGWAWSIRFVPSTEAAIGRGHQHRRIAAPVLTMVGNYAARSLRGRPSATLSVVKAAAGVL